MLKKHNLVPIFILLIGIIPAIFPLFHRGFFITDDGNWMIIRFSAFYEALRQGQFPVRFLSRLNHGYGYPVADFLYPGFMYLGIPIHIIGFNFVNTIKVIFGSSVIASGIFSYLLLRKRFALPASLVGSLAYVYFPYQLYDIYKRGSVGEVLAMSVLPFILWQIERGSLIFTALGIGFLILSHNTLALLFLPIVVGYMLLRKAFRSKYIIYSILLGLGVSAFFWGPALYDKQYTVFDTTAISDYSQYFFGLSKLGLLGITSLLALVMGGFLVMKHRDASSIFFLIVLIIGIFFTTPFSQLFWQYMPLGTFVQFPFRFLAIAAVSVSFIIAKFMSFLPKKIHRAAGLVTLVIIFISALGFVFPERYQDYPDTFYSTNQDTTTVKNEYMPKWVKSMPESVVGRVAVYGTVSNISDKGSSILFTSNALKASVIMVNTVYFPGWEARVDGKKQLVTHDNPYGFIKVPVPAGEHAVHVSFGETPIRLLYDTISLLSMLFLLLLQRGTAQQSPPIQQRDKSTKRDGGAKGKIII